MKDKRIDDYIVKAHGGLRIYSIDFRKQFFTI